MLFLRGLRWRRGFSAAVLLVGLISAAVAAIGPLYARAASESTLTDELQQSTWNSGLAYTRNVPANSPTAVADLVRDLGAATHIRGYGTPIRDESTIITARSRTNPVSTPSTMVWRSEECAHIVLTSGRCPTRTGEAVVPDETATSATAWTVGTALTVKQGVEAPDGIIDGALIAHVTVVGSYRPRDPNGTYWFGLPYFQSNLGPAVTSALKLGADAILVQPGTFRTPLNQDPSVIGLVTVDVPISPSRVRLADVVRLRRDVAAVQRRFPREPGSVTTPSLHTNLAQVLADAARDKRQVQNATLVVVLELAALSLLVLFQVVGGAVEARGDEVALAKLRGLPPRRTVLFALGEPVALLVLSAPLGLLVAWVVTHLLARGALVDGTPVALTGTTGLALIAAFAGSALAAVLAAIRTVTRPVLEQWRNTAPPRHGRRWLLAVDLVLAALAIGTVVALRLGASNRPQPVFLLAPVLVVVAVALLGVRLLPRLGRLGLRPTRASGRIATFLALRQTVRRPSGLRLAVLLAVAAGLAIFAICGEAVAAANRDARAQTEIGTPRQLSVQFETAHDPQTIVDSVDPQGHWAMTTATWIPDGGPPGGQTIIGPVLAVEPDRLPATMYAVRGQLSPRQLRAAITAPDTSPRARFVGTRLRVQLDTSALSGDHPTVEFGIRPNNAPATLAVAGKLSLGVHDYVASVACSHGCSFSGITFDRTAYAQNLITGTVTVRSVATGSGRTLRVPVNDPSSWRGGEIGVGAQLRVSQSNGTMQASFRAVEGSSPVLVYADSPSVLPVAATPRSTATSDNAGGVDDYTGTSATYRVTTRRSPLPDVLDTGAVANLDYMRGRLPNFDRESVWSVWLGPHAPADAQARLERAGLVVQGSSTEAARTALLGRQGPALGLLLLFVCAIAAALLAVGGTAVALLADARRRSFELAALRVVGVAQRTLRRSAVAEQALLLGTAIVLGLPSGYAAAVLVLPVVPEFSDPTPVVLRFQPPILLALGCAAAFVVLLWATATVAGRALARGAVPARLREAAR